MYKENKIHSGNVSEAQPAWLWWSGNVSFLYNAQCVLFWKLIGWIGMLFLCLWLPVGTICSVQLVAAFMKNKPGSQIAKQLISGMETDVRLTRGMLFGNFANKGDGIPPQIAYCLWVHRVAFLLTSPYSVCRGACQSLSHWHRAGRSCSWGKALHYQWFEVMSCVWGGPLSLLSVRHGQKAYQRWSWPVSFKKPESTQSETETRPNKNSLDFKIRQWTSKNGLKTKIDLEYYNTNYKSLHFWIN